jgi:hypothetical protein
VEQQGGATGALIHVLPIIPTFSARVASAGRRVSSLPSHPSCERDLLTWRAAASSADGYGASGYVHQERYVLPEVALGTYAVFGSWIVVGQRGEIVIRANGPPTGTKTRFVPGVIDGRRRAPPQSGAADRSLVQARRSGCPLRAAKASPAALGGCSWLIDHSRSFDRLLPISQVAFISKTRQRRMMDEEAYLRCLDHLRSAEKYMAGPADHWHLARLSLVIERLKECYGPSLRPMPPDEGEA